MNIGELPESVQKRSVLRHFQKATPALPAGLLFSSSGPLPGYALRPWKQVTSAANLLAAQNAVPEGIFLQGILPEFYEEQMLSADMKRFAGEASANGAVSYGEDFLVSEKVTEPEYFVTEFGRLRTNTCSEDISNEQDGIFLLKPGQELVVTRYIAMAGTAAISRIHREELIKRYPLWLIERAENFDSVMSIRNEAEIVSCSCPGPMCSIGRGGIFSALWEMAERAGTGVEADIKKIPVKQETIEICEYFDLNPYCLYSEGSLLIGTDDSKKLINLLQDAGIPGCVIGQVTADKRRVVKNGDSVRFLDRPGSDEFWKVPQDYSLKGGCRM